MTAGTGDMGKAASQRVRNPLGSLHAADLLLIISLAPVFAIMIYDPKSFFLAWNEGRGGLLFAIFFLFMEWFDIRKKPALQLSLPRIFVWLGCVSSLCVFYIGVYVYNLHDWFWKNSDYLGIPGQLNWIWLWEYNVFAIYLFAVTLTLFGFPTLRKLPVPFIYLTGMALILLLDAVFPYNSLAFLGWVIPIITRILFYLLPFSGVKVVDNPFMHADRPNVFFSNNLLYMRGSNGFVVLEVNWPCVGLLSMLIYILIMAVLMVKLDAPRNRKLKYFAIGAVGTFLINIFRIFLITVYVAYISIDVQIFHEIIGEILFLSWVVIFLLLIIRRENKLTQTVTPSLVTSKAIRLQYANEMPQMSSSPGGS